ncbi:hypothetical protein HGB07_09280 [Candidatus Roizmanbacteria bacterium]|nr:hypothetical protein [Candidatus Roizmanbacteria bacterium]
MLIFTQKVFHIIIFTFLVLAFIVFVFSGLILWNILHEKPPQFFPFDDKEASYTILKEHGRYLVEYITTSDRNRSYVCSYSPSGKKTCGYEDDKNVTVIIVSSKIDLAPFVNKKVILTGEFVNAVKQCIAGTCSNIGNWVGVKITSIREK